MKLSAAQLRAAGIERPKAKPRGMNGLEKRYVRRLEERKQLGEVLWWGFEVFRLRLADKTFYKPDFAVCLLTRSGHLCVEFHETKGFMREAARVRLNVAADLFPIRFRKVMASDSLGWIIETVPGLIDRL